MRTLFWDANLDTFNPLAHPDYTILRVLEYGDQSAFAWLRETFSRKEIQRVLRVDRRLSPKSATFWAIVYGIPAQEVAALQESR